MTLCRAFATMDSSSVARKPMRGGPALSEAETRGEKSSKGAKAERGTASGVRVTPLRCERTPQVHESLSFASFGRGVWALCSSERRGRASRGGAEVSFFGAVPRCRSLGRCRGVVLRSGATVSSNWTWHSRLKGQSAVKTVAATGRGKPLRASTPWTDSA